MKERLKIKFEEIFGKTPRIICAPGRINLIGEHTDYNDGFVLPAAIDKSIYLAVTKNDLGKFRFVSYDLNEQIEIPVKNISPVDKQWANYLLGVIAQIKKMNKDIEGVDCVFGGDIPIGSGLSSSAALETGFAFALNILFDLGLDKIDIVKLSQIAEHEYAGVKCGIMDQFASVFGKEDHVIRLDCRSLDYEYFPLKLKDYEVVLCDTKVKHSLASSEYNTRREECESGVKALKVVNPQINSLRDASVSELQQVKDTLDPVAFLRCEFVIEEIERLLNACESLNEGDIVKFGEYMYETHAGLRDKYAVSCKELDILVDIAKTTGYVVGARMMGGGFGGCTINLVKKSKVEDFISLVYKEYELKTGIKPEIYRVDIKNGTNIIS